MNIDFGLPPSGLIPSGLAPPIHHLLSSSLFVYCICLFIYLFIVQQCCIFVFCLYCKLIVTYKQINNEKSN